jgi:hypothetical protein
VVSDTGTQWVRADKDGPLDWFVVWKVTADTFTVLSAAGDYNFPSHPFGSARALLYLGDNGNMTKIPPEPDQTPAKQLILATVMDGNTIRYNPESRGV